MATAIITGASTGIGRELAVLTAQAGYDVVLVARNQMQLESLAASIRTGSRREVRVVAMDLSRPEAPEEIYRAVADLAGEIEILINNAGVGMRGPFATLDAEQQVRMMQLNVGAPTHLTRLLLPSMIERRSGRILNVASTAAFQPGPYMAVYYASKAYLLSLSEALYRELRGSGVTVTALCPGPTATEFTTRADMSKTRLFRTTKVMDAETVARIGFNAMVRGKPLAITGLMNKLVAFSTRFAPRQWSAAIAGGLHKT